MKLFAPEYYKKFKCIADKCTHSCCVGWEIEVDPLSRDKYAKSAHGYAKAVTDSIEPDTSSFRLMPDGRCPHLDSDGLCKIIKNLGEAYLCDICREHPRFYNFTKGGAELGIGASCEEAARIILSSDSYNCTVELPGIFRAEPCEFDTKPLRDRLYSILSDRTMNYGERLTKIYEENGVSPKFLTDSEWRDFLSTLEYLKPEDKALFLSYSSEISELGAEADAMCERALAYFVYRHCSAIDCESEYMLSLGLALFLERLFASLLKTYGAVDAVSSLRTISEELEYSTDNTESIKMQFL